jgi:putative addiction module component (TIGR02574 family)
MPATIDAISSQVFVLPAEQRMQLALALMESVETDNPASANEAWSDEISRRIAAFDSGQTKAVPASEVFRKLREIAPDR